MKTTTKAAGEALGVKLTAEEIAALERVVFALRENVQTTVCETFGIPWDQATKGQWAELGWRHEVDGFRDQAEVVGEDLLIVELGRHSRLIRDAARLLKDAHRRMFEQ